MNLKLWGLLTGSDEARVRSLKRQRQVDTKVAELLEQDAKEMLEEAEYAEDEEKKAEAEARIRMAEELREGGELTVLLAMGVLRDKD